MRPAILVSLFVLLLAQMLAARAIADDGVKVNADFRYRHETISVDDPLATEDQEAQNRHRIRARLAVQGNANDWLKLRFRIATGSSNPATLMQSLDGGFSDKPVSIDLACFDASIPGLQSVHLIGGKIQYPFKTTPLVWDGDVTPEGLALSFSQPLGFIEPLLNAGFFWVEERASDDDSYLIGAQAGAKVKPSEPFHILVCGGLSQYTETKERSPFFDASNSKGNSLDTLGNYMYDYSQIEGYGEVGVKAGTMPFSVFANYVTNTGVDSLNNGFLVGFGLGKASTPNSWQIKYDYRRLERDAVIGAFTDSDPWTGGTDGENHKVHAVYQLAQSTQVGAIFFMGKDGLEEDVPDVTKLRIEVNFRI